MRNLKILMVGLMLIFLGLIFPGLVVADDRDVPGSASWYFYVDFEQQRAARSGQEIYAWLREEVLDEIK